MRQEPAQEYEAGAGVLPECEANTKERSNFEWITHCIAQKVGDVKDVRRGGKIIQCPDAYSFTPSNLHAGYKLTRVTFAKEEIGIENEEGFADERDYESNHCGETDSRPLCRAEGEQG